MNSNLSPNPNLNLCVLESCKLWDYVVKSLYYGLLTNFVIFMLVGYGLKKNQNIKMNSECECEYNLLRLCLD